MTDVWKQTNTAEREQATLVANEIVEVINRAIREGIDRRVVIAGIGSALTDTITCVFGASAVVPWFEGQAKLLRDLQGDRH